MNSSQESLVADSHIPAWINTSCEKPASAKLVSSMESQSNWHLSLPKWNLTPSFKSVSLWGSHDYTSSHHDLDPTCQFFSPKPEPLQSRLQKSVEDNLASRFGVAKKVIQRLLKSAVVEQWGRVQVTDPDTDDMIWAAAMRPLSEDQREASYVRVSSQRPCQSSSLTIFLSIFNWSPRNSCWEKSRRLWLHSMGSSSTLLGSTLRIPSQSSGSRCQQPLCLVPSILVRGANLTPNSLA